MKPTMVQSAAPVTNDIRDIKPPMGLPMAGIGCRRPLGLFFWRCLSVSGDVGRNRGRKFQPLHRFQHMSARSINWRRRWH